MNKFGFYALFQPLILYITTLFRTLTLWSKRQWQEFTQEEKG